MEIVIDIPKEMYEQLKYLNTHGFTTAIEEAVANGIPLPEGHGRLIDADELKKKYPHDTDWDYPVNTNSYVVESIDDAKTIISADKEKRDADSN